MGKKRRLITSQKFKNKHSSHPRLSATTEETVEVEKTVAVQTPKVTVQTTNTQEVTPVVTEAPKVEKTTKTVTSKNTLKSDTVAPKTTKTKRTIAKKTKSTTNKSS